MLRQTQRTKRSTEFPKRSSDLSFLTPKERKNVKASPVLSFESFANITGAGVFLQSWF